MKDVMHFSWMSTGLLSIALSTSAVLGQAAKQPDTDEPTPALSITARSVLVDVVVTDRHGKAVRGLQSGDFEVKENGKRQTVDFFEPHSAESSGSTGPAPALPPNTFTNVPGATVNQAVNVLLMDAQNTQMMDQAYVRMQMVKYLALLPPGIRIGIFLLGDRLRIIQGFTQDSSLLRASIARLAANPSPSPLLPTLESTDAQQTAVSMMQNMAEETANAQLAESASALDGFLRQEVSFEANHQLLVTLESLRTIARYLAAVPGRKNLIWFVGSFPLCLPGVGSSMTGCPFEDDYRKTINVLAAARVSVYPVDATGVLAPSADLSGSGRSAAPSLLAGTSISTGNLSAASASQNPYFGFINAETCAEGTGGKAFHGNGLNQEIEEAIENGSSYYTLAYTPLERQEEGRERKIQITLKNSGYKLAYRRSYYELTQKELKASVKAQPSDPLRPLMDRGMPNFSDLHYQLKVELTPVQRDAHEVPAGDNPALTGRLKRCTVGFALSPEGLSLTRGSDGVRRHTIEVALVAYTQQGWPLNWEVRMVELAIRPEQMSAVRSTGIPVHFTMDIPEGEVFLRTGIYDPASERSGTLEIPLNSIQER